MQRYFFETVNALNWGKFMVGQFDGADLSEPAVVDNITNQRLLRGQGWSPEHFLILDLATGEGAVFKPGGLAAADLEKHKIWVCPMFEPFLEWLYRQDLSNLGALPRVVELPDAPMAMRGYRRPGPPPPQWFEQMRDQMRRYVPCVCTPDYMERGLEDPACRHHDAMDAIDTLEEDHALPGASTA
jgi:hypothetical protein